MPNLGQQNAEKLMEQRAEEYHSKESIFQNVSFNQVPNCKPKPPGAPRGSRLDRAYQAGLVPAEHQKVYNAFRDALEGETSGELVLQRILDYIGMSRTSVLRIIPYLEKYGYIKYEARPKQHCIFVAILK